MNTLLIFSIVTSVLMFPLMFMLGPWTVILPVGCWIAFIATVISKPIKEDKGTKELNQAFSKIEGLYHEFERTNGSCPVSIEFVNPGILSRLCDILKMGRASGSGQAINLLLTDAHTSFETIRKLASRDLIPQNMLIISDFEGRIQ